jgi:hypothetical protein
MTDLVKAIDAALDALAEVKASLSAQAPSLPQPQEASAVAVPGGLVIAWRMPQGAEALPVFLAWGSQGRFLGKVSLPAGTAAHTITGLPQGPCEVDLGYVVPGVSAWPLVRLSASPLAGLPAEPSMPVGEPTGAYPANADADTRRLYIAQGAGCRLAELQPVAGQADLTRLGLPGLWVGSQWNLPRMPSEPLRGLDIKGLVYYTGPEALRLVDSKCAGVRWGASAGKQGGLIQRVTVNGIKGSPLGQGALNFWGQSGWVIDHCELTGFADGIQCSGPGTVSDTWVHDLAYGYSPEQKGPTHNDGIQCYGGRVTLSRCVFDMGGIPGSTNGALFCSTPTASFVADELFVEVTRADVNALHAWQSPEGIVVNGGRVRGGRLIGNVRLNGVER